MNLLAAALFVFVPGAAPAVAHERALEPRLEKLSASETPQSIWREASGAGTHLQSTMACPAAVDGFQRTALLPFDNYGFDVGCNFDSSGVGRVTLYLTRRKGRALKDDFDNADAALKQNKPDVKPMSETPTPGAGLTFTGVLYELGDGARTGLWVADVSGWTFKFRATYRADRQKDVLDAMTALVEQMQKTAGAHLSACAAAAPVVRDGKPITDADEVMSLAIGASAFEGILDEKLEGNAIAEDWCAEEATGDNEAPMLFWRNIANNGNAGPLDRMSLMTMGEPPNLNVAGNPMAGLMREKKADGPLVHQVVEKRGDTTYVFGFYEGRPSAVTLTPLTRDVLLGKKGPVLGFNAKTNTIMLPSDSAKPGS